MSYGYYYYEIEVKHEKLNKYRCIRGRDKHIVEQKAAMQQRAWNEAWAKKKKALDIERIHFDNRDEALAETKEAQELLKNVENTLQHTLPINDAIDWETLKSKEPFSKPKPLVSKLKVTPKPPNKTDSKYISVVFRDQLKSHLHSFLHSKKFQRFATQEEKDKRFQSDYKEWEEQKKKIEQENLKMEKKHLASILSWEAEKKKYIENQVEANKAVDEQKEKYISKDVNALIDYCEMVLTNSKYPDTFPQDFQLEYNSETKNIIVDYRLPDLTDMPTLKEVKYNNTSQEFKEYHLSDTAKNKMYDETLYKITLRTIHELFEADAVNMIDSIVFNGWVKSFDKGTGQEVNPCVLSVQVSKDEFLTINLANVDPKACFKKLKGVGSSKLYGLAAIKPILEISRDDKRFVASYDVIEGIDEGDNIAIMPWEEFEHLIRGIFEKEFSQGGGEVKVTRASRDGGVDAVAFDPDPIRGGKIVIQAKRYINTVGVSAVRDLFGTVMNEGAMKGILITTADYGPEAYEFAKGKPLTLLNGSNLLHLLGKHGHKAKIDLSEAKEYFVNKPSNR